MHDLASTFAPGSTHDVYNEPAIQISTLPFNFAVGSTHDVYDEPSVPSSGHRWAATKTSTFAVGSTHDVYNEPSALQLFFSMEPYYDNPP